MNLGNPKSNFNSTGSTISSTICKDVSDVILSGKGSNNFTNKRNWLGSDCLSNSIFVPNKLTLLLENKTKEGENYE